MMDSKIIDKVLSKNASPDEARQVAAWFATDEGQEYFSQRYDRESYLLNEKIITEWSDHEVPTERMKIRFISQLKTRIRTFRFRVAAAVIIPFIFLAGAFTFVANRTGVFSSEEMAEVTVPYGEQVQVVLQDGTIVQLNSGSRLQYPKSFGLFSRNVKLIGEGYFSVAKEIGRPFIVNLNEIKVKVTGTHFNVKAYSEDEKIRVALEEGSVNIADKRNIIYSLKVGQSAEYDKESGICTISKVPDMTLYTAWRTKSLNFYRTPLRDIIKTLERQYEVQFNVNDSAILDCRFSISTSKINLDEVLNDLEKVSKVKFKLNNENKYTISSMN
jgi:ferric-dicitrate binding protein FerR (iron transport regulator)